MTSPATDRRSKTFSVLSVREKAKSHADLNRILLSDFSRNVFGAPGLEIYEGVDAVTVG